MGVHMATRHIIIGESVASAVVWIVRLNVKGIGQKIFGYSR
jgi:hypothetical protein